MHSVSPITAVLFDLGGVVCRFDPAPRLDRLAALSGLPWQEVFERVWASGLATAFDRGDCSTEEWRTVVNAQLGLSLDAASFEDVMLSALTVDDDVLKVVDELRGHGVRVGMLTDNPPLLFDAMPRRFSVLLGRFDPMLFSFQLGVLKPAEEAFRLALEALGADAREVCFIDDTAANVEAAAAMGMHALQFASAAALREQLRAGGLSIEHPVAAK
jgi:putative hydrolase of the HAD superfamily